MTSKTRREQLQAKLVQAQRLKELVSGHPLMSKNYESIDEDFKLELEKIPFGKKEARSVMLFSGEPVQGSEGIDAAFAARVLAPFQSMVMADYADRFHGVVAQKGRRCGEADSRLMLTDLPKGSFGFELSKAESGELFEEEQLADTLSHVTRLVESTAESDENFAAELNDSAPRVIQNLKEFLKAVSKSKAGLRLESGDLRCDLTPDDAQVAFTRVNNTSTEIVTVRLSGISNGMLLDSWRYDFREDNGHKISGKISDDFTIEQVKNLNQKFFGNSCVGTFEKVVLKFRNGSERTSYTLLSLEEPTS